jgi:hypothetical protein
MPLFTSILCEFWQEEIACKLTRPFPKIIAGYGQSVLSLRCVFLMKGDGFWKMEHFITDT